MSEPVDWREVDIDMMTTDPVEQEYLEGLTDFEFMAYQSAQACLGTSFSVRRSKGFIAWVSAREDAN